MGEELLAEKKEERKCKDGCLAANRGFLGFLVKAALPVLIWLTERDAPLFLTLSQCILPCMAPL